MCPRSHEQHRCSIDVVSGRAFQSHLLQFGSRALPRPLIWPGVVTGAYHLVGDPVQLALNHSPAGATGPVGVALVLVWLLAVTIVMLVRPVWNAGPKPAAVATEASLVS